MTYRQCDLIHSRFGLTGRRMSRRNERRKAPVSGGRLHPHDGPPRAEPTARVTPLRGTGLRVCLDRLDNQAGVDNAWEQEKLEARKCLKKPQNPTRQVRQERAGAHFSRQNAINLRSEKRFVGLPADLSVTGCLS